MGTPWEKALRVPSTVPQVRSVDFRARDMEVRETIFDGFPQVHLQRSPALFRHDPRTDDEDRFMGI